MTQFFEPWKGCSYKAGGLLFLSESAYTWKGGRPGPDHPTKNTVEHWSFKAWDKPGRGHGTYARKMTRTLCGKINPSEAERKAAWGKVAYSIYLQAVLASKEERPSLKMFRESGQAFIGLLQELQPARVVITGFEVWKGMPKPDARKGTMRKAYKIRGRVVWCLALPHPQSRQPRFDWRKEHSKIKIFLAEKLPQTLPAT